VVVKRHSRQPKGRRTIKNERKSTKKNANQKKIKLNTMLAVARMNEHQSGVANNSIETSKANVQVVSNISTANHTKRSIREGETNEAHSKKQKIKTVEDDEGLVDEYIVAPKEATGPMVTASRTTDIIGHNAKNEPEPTSPSSLSSSPSYSSGSNEGRSLQNNAKNEQTFSSSFSSPVSNVMGGSICGSTLS
jgi:hypothetical protein